MSSFLVNTALILAMSCAVIQFCASAFSAYANSSMIFGIFGSQVRAHARCTGRQPAALDFSVLPRTLARCTGCDPNALEVTALHWMLSRCTGHSKEGAVRLCAQGPGLSPLQLGMHAQQAMASANCGIQSFLMSSPTRHVAVCVLDPGSPGRSPVQLGVHAHHAMRQLLTTYRSVCCCPDEGHVSPTTTVHLPVVCKLPQPLNTESPTRPVAVCPCRSRTCWGYGTSTSWLQTAAAIEH